MMEFNNYGDDDVQKTDRNASPTTDDERRGLEASDQTACKPRFGRHEAHKRHDTMGEILQNDTDSAKFKYNHDNDFVDSRFKELIPHPEVVGVQQTDRYGNSVKLDLKFHHSTLW